MGADDKYEVEFESADGKATHQLWIEDGVVFTKGVGDFDTELTTKVVESVLEARRHLGRRFPIVIDVSAQDGVSPEGRKLFGDEILMTDQVITRLALIGGNFFIRSLFNLYSLVSRVPLKAFKSKRAALAWAKEDQGG